MPAFCRRLPSPRYIWTFPLCTPFPILYQSQASLLDLYQRGLAIDKIADRLDALDKEKATLQDSLQELRMEKKAARDEEERLGPERAHELMGEFLDAVDGDADLDTRRKLLGSLIEKIIVKRTPGDFDIYWTF